MGGKNSGGGPKWAIRQERLSAELAYENRLRARMSTLIERVRPGWDDFEEDQDKDVMLEEAKQAIKTWFSLYHSVVLLVAAMNPPGVNKVNTPEEGHIPCPPGIPGGRYCFRQSYLLPAFGLEENDDYSMSGLKFDQNIEKLRSFYESGDMGRDFIHEINSVQPTFRDILRKYKPVSLSTGEILERCRASASNLPSPHDLSNNHVSDALNRIEDLWGMEINEHLNEVSNWHSDASSDTLAWWNSKIGIDNDLGNRISDLFDNGDDDKKEKVGELAAVIDFSEETFAYVYNRLVYEDDRDISHGLEGVVGKYTDTDRPAWEALLSITCAAIAWQIFNQAKLAVDRLREILA